MWVKWTTLYLLLQTRQGCYASFCLHFTLCCGLEKKPLLNKVRKPNGYVHVLPYVRSILIVSLFFSVVLIFSLSTSKSWKTFYVVKLHTEFHPFIFFPSFCWLRQNTHSYMCPIKYAPSLFSTVVQVDVLSLICFTILF